jgi:DNA polymerase-3 subunit epsilon
MGWLDHWRAPPVDDNRWVVLDVESSGLDPARDDLLAIAALALRFADGTPRLCLADSFEVVLRRDRAQVDKANILVHGIGVGAQRSGVEPAPALRAFGQWLGTSPLIAFHSAFDETLIQRAMHAVLGQRLRNPWVDLAQLAEVAAPKVRAKSLDEWLVQYSITCAVRHQAAADTLATAELLLRLWPALRPQLPKAAPPGFAALRRLADQRRWLNAR